MRGIIKMTARTALVLAVMVLAAFVLVSVSPVDPLSANVGQAALGSMSPEQVERLKEYWGVGQPVAERFVKWAGDFLRGDMGVSLLYRRPVAQVIAERFTASLGIMTAAWVCSGVLGILLGASAGIRRGGAADKIVTGYSLVTASTPAFWLALILLMVFSVWLRVFPIGFGAPIGVEAADVTLADRVSHGILPAAALTVTGISSIALHTREKMLQVMESDYVLFARARGESTWTIVRRHGLRNILLPAVTLQFASVSELLGGTILVEQVFSYPGMGQAAVNAGLGGDVPLLMGIVAVSGCMVCAGNLAGNIINSLVDPRIREGAGRR